MNVLVRLRSMGGYRREFDHSLECIEVRVIELFAMVIEDLPAATWTLLHARDAAAETLAGHEKLVDALYVEIEGLAGREILLQAPVASDLRFLITVLRIVPELERSHDLVVDIAARAPHIPDEDLSPRIRELAAAMGDLASGMWQQAADAWYSRDRSAAAAMGERDAKMGDLHASLTDAITAGVMPARTTAEMALAARDYRRLGAHAINIARRVGYLAGSSRM